MDCSLISLYFAANILVEVSTYNVFFFLCLGYLTQHHIFFLVLALQIFWCPQKNFHSWIILHSVNVYFLYSLFDWGASRLFPCSGYCEEHCNDHNWGSVFVECLSFLRVYTQEWYRSKLKMFMAMWIFQDIQRTWKNLLNCSIKEEKEGTLSKYFYEVSS